MLKDMLPVNVPFVQTSRSESSASIHQVSEVHISHHPVDI